MRHSPSIVPTDRLDRDIYLVLEDFGARAGCFWFIEANGTRPVDVQLALPLRMAS